VTDRALLLEQLHAAVDALTNSRRTFTPITYWDANRHRRTRQHEVNHLPLLEALLEAAYPGSTGERGGRSVPGSRPPLRLDAIDRYVQVQQEAKLWRRRLQIDAAGLVATVKGFGVHASQIDAEALTELTGAARCWVVWAETATGERAPLFAPDAPCPVCERRHGLRVNVAEQRAYCRHCTSWWDESSIGVLGAHVARWTERQIGESA
jgi:hypothetical protein